MQIEVQQNACEVNLCPCGCGEPVKDGRRFVTRGCALRLYIREHPEHQSEAGKRVAEIMKERDSLVFVKMGKIGGKRLHELHPNLAHDNGVLTHQLHPEQARMMGKRTHELHPEMYRELGRNSLKAQNKRPTYLEQRILNLIQQNSLPYGYVGDGQLVIGGKNPDFVHRSEKVLLEVADKRDKERRQHRPWQDYERERIKHFGFNEWKCIVLWSDMKDEDILKKLEEMNLRS